MDESDEMPLWGFAIHNPRAKEVSGLGHTERNPARLPTNIPLLLLLPSWTAIHKGWPNCCRSTTSGL
jgi:hypothetical protein